MTICVPLHFFPYFSPLDGDAAEDFGWILKGGGWVVDVKLSNRTSREIMMDFDSRSHILYPLLWVEYVAIIPQTLNSQQTFLEVIKQSHLF